MSLTFPTGRHGWDQPGQPSRASHCRCHGGPMIIQPVDTCLRCGHYPKATVADTWQRRAQERARKRRGRDRLAA